MSKEQIKPRPRRRVGPDYQVLTAQQVHDVLAEAKEGKGCWPVMLQVVEAGLTHADPVVMAFSAQAYDGEIIWIIADGKNRVRNAHEGLF